MRSHAWTDAIMALLALALSVVLIVLLFALTMTRRPGSSPSGRVSLGSWAVTPGSQLASSGGVAGAPGPGGTRRPTMAATSRVWPADSASWRPALQGLGGVLAARQHRQLAGAYPWRSFQRPPARSLGLGLAHTTPGLSTFAKPAHV